MRLIFIIAIFFTCLSACQSRTGGLLTFSGLTMGTTYSVKIASKDPIIDKATIHSDIEKILKDINQLMSTYIDNSELSRFNQNKSTDWQDISLELYTVIEHANYISRITSGAFDMTVGPLVNLWGFGPNPDTQEIPSDPVIATIKQYVGYEKINFNKSSKQILKTDPEIYIDLSGIAKGFAVDKIADYMNEKNFDNYLVEIGGELIGKGQNDRQQAWQIGIERARPLDRSVQHILSLENIAMATSGNYRNYYEKEGVRYSHTIDPVTGKPIMHKLASVTVLDKSAMHADAMATAFMVLGPEKTMLLANQLNLAVYIIVKTKTGFEEKYNDYFKPYLSE